MSYYMLNGDSRLIGIIPTTKKLKGCINYGGIDARTGQWAPMGTAKLVPCSKRSITYLEGIALRQRTYNDAGYQISYYTGKRVEYYFNLDAAVDDMKARALAY